MSVSKLKETRKEAEIQFRGEVLWAISMSAFLIASADGELAEAELETMISNIAEISGEPDVSPEALEELFGVLAEAYEVHGFDYCAQEVAQRLPTQELRHSAVIISGGIALIDGELTDSEEQAFLRLAGALGFSPEEATAIVNEAMAE